MNTSISTLNALAAAEAECTRCPLYKNATHVVPGQGAARARMMLVGEQPGDREDIKGLPFIGPAGRILDQAIEAAGIERKRVFVTNAVKHFKFEPRGKRRLHKRPNAHEIERCHWWLDFERKIVKPVVVIALGATAARSVLGKPVTIGTTRGRIITHDHARVIVTIHPSYLLRIRDAKDKEREYSDFVRDLHIGLAALDYPNR